jgi:hypothetical protein
MRTNTVSSMIHSAAGRRAALAAAVAAAVLSPEVAHAAPGALDTDLLLKHLVSLLVIAIVMESALTALFQWRVYREFFNSRALKTVIMAATGLAVVKGFDYDIFQKVVEAAGGNGSSPILSAGLSSLVFAGGSAAIFELFKRLGFRAPFEQQSPETKVPETKAWVSVRVKSGVERGPFDVMIDKIENPTDPQKQQPALSGVIGQKTLGERLSSLFFADPTRHPPYGGRTVEAGAVYRIVVKRSKEPLDKALSDQICRFANRAIVDLVVEV